MDALQREIVDERRIRFNVHRETGVGSIGLLGLCPGTTLSMAGSGAPVDLPRHNLLPVSRFSERDFNNINPAKGGWIAHGRTDSPRQVTGFRERELEWRRTHAETLKQYKNEWLVLEGEQIIAHGADPVQVIQEAKRNGIVKPYIFFVEQEGDNVVRIGL